MVERARPAYEESLKQKSSDPLAILRIPKIGLEVAVLEGTDDLTLNRAIGHIEDTAEARRKRATSASPGHRDGFFRGLKDVVIGDHDGARDPLRQERYRVEDIWIVNPEDIQRARPHPEAARSRSSPAIPSTSSAPPRSATSCGPCPRLPRPRAGSRRIALPLPSITSRAPYLALGHRDYRRLIVSQLLSLTGSSRPHAGAAFAPFPHRHHPQGHGRHHIDFHHTTEDLSHRPGPGHGKGPGRRQGHPALCRLPVAHGRGDDAGRHRCVGPPLPDLDGGIFAAKIGDFDTELVREWFQAFAMNAGVTLHVEALYGDNCHHIAESCFKALARVLRQAVEIDPRQKDRIPSTKGTLAG